jgi:hypothetical protein
MIMYYPESRSGGSVWVFLDGDGFLTKPIDFAYWILLDFLGFSRPNRDFSMGYGGFSREEISQLFPRRSQRPDR